MRWPRLMGRETAAEYCDVSVGHFAAHCPVQPVRVGSRVLWDRLQLDAWVDGLSGGGQAVNDASIWLERLDRAHNAQGRP